MSTPVKDFSGVDFELAIGEVYGLRVWKMDDFGRLRAKNLDKAGPWRPGINIARCHAEGLSRVIDPTGAGRRAVEVRTEWDYNAGGIIPAYTTSTSAGSRVCVTWDDGTSDVFPPGKVVLNQVDHAVPDEGCACGFYAYSDPQHEETGARSGHAWPNPSASAIGGWITPTITFGSSSPAPKTPSILGVVRGSGRTLIGTKGFRCEKAEIVALRDPTRGGKKTAEWRQRQLANLERIYPDVPLLPSRSALLEFAPIQAALPDPSTDEFWSLP